ncbi:hypothetical protein ACF91D_28560 [Staphylococcus sp. 231237_7MaSpsaltlick]|uniref:hypothetical protein n=1 Tax=Staphylococcus TaxID=1279 RepID=UPI003709F92E
MSNSRLININLNASNDEAADHMVRITTYDLQEKDIERWIKDNTKLSEEKWRIQVC